MNLIPYIVVWGVLAIVVLGLLFYRTRITAREDDSLHFHKGEESKVAEQSLLAKKLEAVDRWGKILTVIVVIYGLVLCGVYAYQSFFASDRVMMG